MMAGNTWYNKNKELRNKEKIKMKDAVAYPIKLIYRACVCVCVCTGYTGCMGRKKSRNQHIKNLHG
jgi:hypothetical protein